MPIKNVLEFLSPRARQVLYVVFALVGLALGATSVGFSAADLSTPVWVDVAQEVYLFLGVGFGVVASSNVNAPESYNPHIQE